MKMRWLLLLLLFPLCACLKEAGKNYYLHQDARDYAVFQQDSRWVYQNANNAQIDTNTILNSALEMKTSLILQYHYEVHYSTLKSSWYRENLVYTAIANADEINRTAISLKYAAHLWLSKDIFAANLQVNQAIFEKVLYVKHYPVYEVAGKTYTDVREFEAIYPPDYTQQEIDKIDQRTPQRVWYARHVGIIKKQLFNGETWHLIQHEVKQ